MKFFILLILLAGVTSCTNTPESDISNHQNELLSLHQWLETNAVAVFRFWDAKSAQNNAKDGFYGDIDLDGNSKKGIRNSIQQARQLFTISVWNLMGNPDDDDALTAYNQYRYFIRTFHDAKGGEFFINERDNPNNPERRLYNNSFAIYGLAHYYLAFHDHENKTYREAADEALAIALQTFVAMDKRAHDRQYLGYQQIPVNGLAANEAELDGGDKEANTHLHIMEALTTLFEAWQLAGSDLQPRLSAIDLEYIGEHLQARLDEMLVDVMVKRFCKERDEYAYCRTEFERDWSLANDTHFSFGHDIETAWLFMEALRVLGDDVSDKQSVISMTEKLIYTVHQFGMEEVNGGIANIALGNISDFSVRSDGKDWWQHFEALAGFYKGARITDKAELQREYLSVATGLTHYIDNGGLKVAFDDSMWEYKWGDYLANEWKAGYHTIRALLFVQNWIEQDLDMTN